MLKKVVNWLKNLIVMTIPPKYPMGEPFKEEPGIIITPTTSEQVSIDIFKRIALYLYVEAIVVLASPQILTGADGKWKKPLSKNLMSHNMPPKQIKQALLKIAPVIERFRCDEGVDLHLRFIGAAFNAWDEALDEEWGEEWLRERESYTKTVFWDYGN